MSFFAHGNIPERTGIAYLGDQNSAAELPKGSKISLPCRSTKPSYSHVIASLLIITLALGDFFI